MFQIMGDSEDKGQLNLWVSRETKNRLDALAREFKMGKGTKAGAEIVETYIERWAKLERRKRQ